MRKICRYIHIKFTNTDIKFTDTKKLKFLIFLKVNNSSKNIQIGHFKPMSRARQTWKDHHKGTITIEDASNIYKGKKRLLLFFFFIRVTDFGLNSFSF